MRENAGAHAHFRTLLGNIVDSRSGPPHSSCFLIKKRFSFINSVLPFLGDSGRLGSMPTP